MWCDIVVWTKVAYQQLTFLEPCCEHGTVPADFQFCSTPNLDARQVKRMSETSESQRMKEQKQAEVLFAKAAYSIPNI